jgi:signal transduction histidine kinase
MTMHVSAALIEDRHRIARALHDTVAPKVMTLGMHVVWARGAVSDPEIVGRLAETELLARETMDAIRQSIFELSCLDEAPRDGLVARLRQIVGEYRAEGLAVSLCVAGTPRDAPAELERQLALVAREGLRNVLSHARAARAVVRLTFGRATMRLSVLDDGVGVPTDLDPRLGPTRRRRDGYQCGLAFLESAVAAMGGRMSVSEARMGGVRLSVVVPTTGWQ